jgi:glucan phosphoethanolaminetransferase (alkaline phosphatase superfamily)
MFTNTANIIPYSLYLIYYFGFLFTACFLFMIHIRKNQMKRIYIWWVSLFVLTVTVPVILIAVLPNLKISFPSIYCEFSLLFSIAAIITSEIYHNNKKKERLIG